MPISQHCGENPIFLLERSAVLTEITPTYKTHQQLVIYPMLCYKLVSFTLAVACELPAAEEVGNKLLRKQR